MYLLPVIVKKETTTNMIWLKLRLVFNKTFISSALADMGWDLECILHTVGKTQHLPQLLSSSPHSKCILAQTHSGNIGFQWDLGSLCLLYRLGDLLGAQHHLLKQIRIQVHILYMKIYILKCAQLDLSGGLVQFDFFVLFCC